MPTLSLRLLSSFVSGISFFLLANPVSAQAVRLVPVPTVRYVVAPQAVAPVASVGYTYGYTAGITNTTTNTNSNTNNNSTRFHILNSVTGQGPTNSQPVTVVTNFQSGNVGGSQGGGYGGIYGGVNAFGANGFGTGFGNTGINNGNGNGGATPPPGVLLSAQYGKTFFPASANPQAQGIGIGGYPGAGFGFGGGFGFPGGGVVGGGYPGGALGVPRLF